MDNASFRVSRKTRQFTKTGITTPTVKARFTRLVNVGFIKSVSPIFDYSIVENENILKPEFDKQQNGRIENSQ